MAQDTASLAGYPQIASGFQLNDYSVQVDFARDSEGKLLTDYLGRVVLVPRQKAVLINYC